MFERRRAGLNPRFIFRGLFGTTEVVPFRIVGAIAAKVSEIQKASPGAKAPDQPSMRAA